MIEPDLDSNDLRKHTTYMSYRNLIMSNKIIMFPNIQKKQREELAKGFKLVTYALSAGFLLMFVTPVVAYVAYKLIY